MSGRNLEIALRIRADLASAMRGLDRLEKELGGVDDAAAKTGGRMRRLGGAMSVAVRGKSVLGRHVRYLSTALTGGLSHQVRGTAYPRRGTPSRRVYPCGCGGTEDGL